MLNRTITTSISIDIPTYVYLREVAQRERCSMSSVIREAIARGLETTSDDETTTAESEERESAQES